MHSNNELKVERPLQPPSYLILTALKFGWPDVLKQLADSEFASVVEEAGSDSPEYLRRFDFAVVALHFRYFRPSLSQANAVASQVHA
mmetsp:Transcript_112856/g.177565  ORF Transcript_112856/g.177565 Transcript_112856/m.177565 type:complete len:87 (-) Transcript_112856:1006-1266(-)